jgi:hypothetical protein
VMEEGKKEMELTSQEKKLIDVIRKVQYGEVKIIINDGKPIRIEEVKKSIKL